MNQTQAQVDPRPRGIPAKQRASMARAHLELADGSSQPLRLQHQESARNQLNRALEALKFEMEQDS